MFFPIFKYELPVFSNEGREPGRWFQGFDPARHVDSDSDLEQIGDGVVVVTAERLREFIKDAHRYRFLTRGDRSITVHDNDGTPVGFFCGTREEVSEQIDDETAKEEYGKEE